MSEAGKILTDKFLSKYQGKQPNWGFGGLGYVVYRRTYSRIKPDGSNEEWNETVARCIEGAQNIGAEYSKEEAERLFDHVFNLRCNFAGRMLWQLGTSTVDRFGANSLLNCWMVSMNESKAFLFLFENLMLGGGVGFSVRREDVHELPRIKKCVKVVHKPTKDADFIVPDSREGWIKLLKHILDAYYITGKSFSYSTILIRGAGEPIKGFGGTASGPKILMEGMEKICQIFQSREEKKLRSIDVLDICNIIGSIVVAGNVRRSAQIALGDPDDYYFLRAKNWSLGGVPNWRAMSNNTIYADGYDHISREIWENGYEIDSRTGTAKGEPYGFFNLPLSQKFGRIKDGPMRDCRLYPVDKDNVVGTNPCSEISLASYECCNLSELYLNNIRSKDELIDCSRLLYKTQKVIASLPFIHEETNTIVHKNMRLGLGITGVCQSLDKISWLDDCYVELRRFDKEWSKYKGWPRSIKLTTVKPSGCSRKDSLIITNNGILRLDEIGDVSGRQWQLIDDLKSNDDKITKFYVNGNVKTKIIRTKDGFEYESSLNHRYLIDGEWKYVSDLKIGDNMTATLGGYSKISEPTFKSLIQEKITNNVIIKQPNYLDADLAFFLGLFYSDGSVHEKGIRISFNRRDNDLIVLLKSIIKKSFGLESNIDDNHGLYINSIFLKTWLRENGILKDYCEELKIPRVIRQASINSIKAFITGYWRGDGGQHNKTTWSICSVSRSFVQELAVLMRAVGYNPSIGNAGPGGYGKLDRWIILNRISPTRYHSREFKDRMLPNDQWKDPIIEIFDSECCTYDIEVENSHKYILNGTVSHNTLSLLGGATPGIHPAYAQYYIRRVRMASGDKLINSCRDAGYRIEYVKNLDGTDSYDTVVVEFPCQVQDGSILAKDMGVIKQLDMVAKLQSEWSDNAVSVTAYYEPNELPVLKSWLKDNYEKNIKSVSFLLRDKHGFLQAPYSEITKEEYDIMAANIKPIKIDNGGDMIQDFGECSSGACPIR